MNDLNKYIEEVASIPNYIQQLTVMMYIAMFVFILYGVLAVWTLSDISRPLRGILIELRKGK